MFCSQCFPDLSLDSRGGAPRKGKEGWEKNGGRERGGGGKDIERNRGRWGGQEKGRKGKRCGCANFLDMLAPMNSGRKDENS